MQSRPVYPCQLARSLVRRCDKRRRESSIGSQFRAWKSVIRVSRAGGRLSSAGMFERKRTRQGRGFPVFPAGKGPDSFDLTVSKTRSLEYLVHISEVGARDGGEMPVRLAPLGYASGIAFRSTQTPLCSPRASIHLISEGDQRSPSASIHLISEGD